MLFFFSSFEKVSKFLVDCPKFDIALIFLYNVGSSVKCDNCTIGHILFCSTVEVLPNSLAKDILLRCAGKAGRTSLRFLFF